MNTTTSSRPTARAAMHGGRRFSSLRARGHAQRTRTQTTVLPDSLTCRIAYDLQGISRYCNCGATVPASSVRAFSSIHSTLTALRANRYRRRSATVRGTLGTLGSGSGELLGSSQLSGEPFNAPPRRARLITPTNSRTHSRLVVGSTSRRRRQARIALQARSISRSSMPLLYAPCPAGCGFDA